MKPQTKYLKSLGACSEGIRSAARFPPLQAAWDACDNLADMQWLLKAPHWAAYEAACAAHRAAYEAACAAHRAAYEAACAAIDACNTCDEVRSKFACPVIPQEDV